MTALELLPDVLANREIGDPCRAVLVALVTMEPDPTCPAKCYSMHADGRVRICREELRHALGGINDKAVSNRIAEAKRAGLLKHESGGRNGTVSGYRLVRQYRRPGPESLVELLAATLQAREEALVGTTPVVPREGSDPLVGTTGIAPYARAQYSKCDAHPEQAPDGSRAEREDDVTEQAVNYKGWPTPPSKRPSFRPVEGEVAS